MLKPTTEFILIPLLNDQLRHWVLLVVQLKIKGGEITLVESVAKWRTTDWIMNYVSIIWCLLEDYDMPKRIEDFKPKNWILGDCTKFPEQSDTFNCGTCVCASIELFLKRLDIDDI